ncbi:XPA protein C-terminus-domain-containing protein [Dunaliella salina]|uniref:XPA protein C-terminus-domain-containing protein n=1 Tax=Dunaliella salina TaxID=3046 RepID=A0ABQ7GZ98_DUNSA|nr:XPA protein C-terminus-domain-containing protein [Dunaliella salina]|eukprot:KAF5839908.1 XPA protein C-terminus-domain-containing protein [Dunaliella salina]
MPVCEACGCLSLCPKMLQHFNVHVCANCAATCDEYKLISKGTAKSKYMVTDNDLKRLGFIRKANPHKQQWADMMLYLTSQVAAIAESKHGNVREAQHNRMEEKIKSRLGKRTALEREGEEEGRDPHAPKLLNPGQERVRKRILSEYGEQQRQQQQQEAIESGGCAETEEI